MTETIGDAIRKALAPNRRDGPGFIKAMERFNAAMQDIQIDGSLASWLEIRGSEMRGREWGKLVDVVHDQAYARVVGPYSHELEVCPNLTGVDGKLMSSTTRNTLMRLLMRLPQRRMLMGSCVMSRFIDDGRIYADI